MCPKQASLEAPHTIVTMTVVQQYGKKKKKKEPLNTGASWSNTLKNTIEYIKLYSW